MSIHLFGQEINPETYAITKSDLLLKGEGEEAENFRWRLNAFAGRLPWQRLRLHALESALREELEDRSGAHGRQGGHARPALRHHHGNDPEFSLITRSSDGQLLFLVNMLTKMKHDTDAGQPHRGGA